MSLEVGGDAGQRGGSEKIKNEPRDPRAFERFKEFTRRILQVSKDGVPLFV